MGWTKERLEDVVRARLGGAKLIVVANREPYVHTLRGGVIEWHRPAGGRTTALDPVMRACGGVWVADHNIYRWAGGLLGEACELAGGAAGPPVPDGVPAAAPVFRYAV